MTDGTTDQSANDYDVDLSTRRYNRLYAEESALAFSALECVLRGAMGVYASSEITTGRRAYAMLSRHGCLSLSSIDSKERQALIDGNLRDALTFAQELGERLPAGNLVISPAPFYAPEWSQAEYLAFWQTLICTRASAVYFRDDWFYSNGCTFEFAVARENRIPTFDARLAAIDSETAVASIESAIHELRAGGFDTSRLTINMERVRRAR